MQKYVCNVCGFIYDESFGYPEGSIAPGTIWEDMPDDWLCPLCGASKTEFKELTAINQTVKPVFLMEEERHEPLRELSSEELSVLFSNLSKGCEKQYRTEETALFNQLAEYYKHKCASTTEKQLSDLIALVEQDLESGYEKANQIAASSSDRGALRALTWNEKVTRILSSLLRRYEKQQNSLLENSNVYICEICGFVYIGEEVPELCPVCKVPNLKIAQIQRG